MSLDEVALIMDYGGVNGGREGAMAAMHELRANKAQEDGEKGQREGVGEKEVGGTMIEDVAQLETGRDRRAV